MKKQFKILTVAFLGLFILSSAASAHEHQTFRIGDKIYAFTVGSLGEPVVVGDKTGVDLRVVEVGGGDRESEEAGIPVSGLEQTLKVELIAGTYKMVQNLSPAFGVPGGYRTTFYPSVQTTYSYRVFGTINDTSVDLTFSCNPAGHPVVEEENTEVRMGEGVIRTSKSGSFGCPVAKENFVFPVTGAANTNIEGAVSNVNDQAVFSQFLALISLVFGIGGLTAGVVAMMGFWTLRRK